MQETTDEFYKRQLKEIDREYKRDVLAITLAVAITIIYLIVAPAIIGIWSVPGLIVLVPTVCKFVIDPITR